MGDWRAVLENVRADYQNMSQEKKELLDLVCKIPKRKIVEDANANVDEEQEQEQEEENEIGKGDDQRDEIGNDDDKKEDVDEQEETEAVVDGNDDDGAE